MPVDTPVISTERRRSVCTVTTVSSPRDASRSVGSEPHRPRVRPLRTIQRDRRDLLDNLVAGLLVVHGETALWIEADDEGTLRQPLVISGHTVKSSAEA